MHRCGKEAGADVAAMDTASRGGRLEKWDGVIPADVFVSVATLEEVDKVGAALDENMLRVDYFVQRSMWIGIGASADVRLALEQHYTCTGA